MTEEELKERTTFFQLLLSFIMLVREALAGNLLSEPLKSKAKNLINQSFEQLSQAPVIDKPIPEPDPKTLPLPTKDLRELKLNQVIEFMKSVGVDPIKLEEIRKGVQSDFELLHARITEDFSKLQTQVREDFLKLKEEVQQNNSK